MSIPQYLIEITGVSGEVIRFGLGLASAFPLSFLFLKIPKQSVTVKHWFSIVSVGFLITYIFRLSAFVELLGLCLVVYLLGLFLGTMRIGPLVIFTVALCHMAYIHLENQFWKANDPSYVDYSSMMMVLLIKLSSFGYNVYDGAHPEELNEYQMKKSIKSYPTLVEFLGYCFFFNGVWVGPAIDYNHYKSFIESEAPYKTIPSTTIPALKCLSAGIIMVVLEAYISPHYHFLLVSDPKFTSLSFFGKIIFLTTAGMVVRAKYYAVWKVSEASALVSGVGVGLDKDNKYVYNACENVNMMDLETGENVRAVMDAWNKFTANWLRRYVYDRVKIRGLKLPLTFFISAFWHGFYPGYYLSFLFSVPLTECGRTMRRNVRPLFLDGGPLRFFKFGYDFLGSILTIYCMNTLFICFLVRRMDTSIAAWREMYFLGHILFFTPIILLEGFGLKKYLIKRKVE